MVPFANSVLASRTPFLRSVDDLRAEGVRLLFGPGEFEPHAPGTGGEHFDIYPWKRALSELAELGS